MKKKECPVCVYRREKAERQNVLTREVLAWLKPVLYGGAIAIASLGTGFLVSVLRGGV